MSIFTEIMQLIQGKMTLIQEFATNSFEYILARKTFDCRQSEIRILFLVDNVNLRFKLDMSVSMRFTQMCVYRLDLYIFELNLQSKTQLELTVRTPAKTSQIGQPTSSAGNFVYGRMFIDEMETEV